MAKLSVNVNKVATVRNSRGGRVPSVIDAVRVCLDAGAPGITVHPRADERHITAADVREITEELAPLKGRVEYNIEGDPRAELVASSSTSSPISARWSQSRRVRSRARPVGRRIRRDKRSPGSSPR